MSDLIGIKVCKKFKQTIISKNNLQHIKLITQISIKKIDYQVKPILKEYVNINS